MDTGHGRIETRTLRATPLVTYQDRWKGLKQGFRITRTRTVKGVTTVEVMHGITRLPVERADARALLGLVRSHWRIENQLHYVRDVTFGEDACRVRKGAAPQVLAALRNAAIHMLATISADSTPEALEWLQLHPEHAHKLIGITQRE
ncbi:ISAs1 family transposase [Gemmata sp. JC673]|uniref:ISAs1 family transposase n=1 Tax=Gemmata algarum TaxID=2975278 RepID=A0ABU5EUK9_9BACT|nr:ISAs1 family transposase [Gemmata algarum]MDY3558860.1 ISAs1 family transposase [Gemmata algarum]